MLTLCVCVCAFVHRSVQETCNFDTLFAYLTCGNYDFRYDMQKGLRPRRSVRMAMTHGEQLVAFNTTQPQLCNSWLTHPYLCVCAFADIMFYAIGTLSSTIVVHSHPTHGRFHSWCLQFRRMDLAWTSASRRPSRACRATMSR